VRKVSEKVILILVDGMRPDSLGNIEFTQKFLKQSSYTMNAKTVMPSITLPCHMSLFHSVDPQRHGILTNTYTPQVRPIKGLCEQLKASKKKCAFFYNWEELRDLTRREADSEWEGKSLVE
jgi:predicted AlkP superfamily pyrophosphatase or phosphodiesterase